MNLNFLAADKKKKKSDKSNLKHGGYTMEKVFRGTDHPEEDDNCRSILVQSRMLFFITIQE